MDISTDSPAGIVPMLKVFDPRFTILVSDDESEIEDESLEPLLCPESPTFTIVATTPVASELPLLLKIILTGLSTLGIRYLVSDTASKTTLPGRINGIVNKADLQLRTCSGVE